MTNQSPAEGDAWRKTVECAHAFLAVIKDCGCQVKWDDGKPTPNGLLAARLYRELGDLLTAHPQETGLYPPVQGSQS